MKRPKPEQKLPETTDSTPKTEKDKKPKNRVKMTRGGRNLVILGIVSTLIAILTTTIGLAIYHLSGDIYLDRSRPGYLPDEAEVVEEAEAEPEEFNFDKSGKLTKDQLEEYLKHLSEEINAVDNYKDPFSASVLSDDRLDLPKDE